MLINPFKRSAQIVLALSLFSTASLSRSEGPPTAENHVAPGVDEKRMERFEKQAADLRRLLRIPGLSAVILKNQRIIWAKGFGEADVERHVPATPDTLYHVASLTKTFGATLIMQLVEQGKLDLDEPIAHYSKDFKGDSVKIKHLLSHTSTAPAGERYRYDGNNYDYVTTVLEKKTGKSLRELIVKTFLDPLSMSASVPSHNIVDEADKWAPHLGKENLGRYAKNLSRLAQPYTLYGDSEIVHVPYPPKNISAAAGLLSTVLDMAKYDVAIDRHRFLKSETQKRAWTPLVSSSGRRLPHALGWFATDYHGLRLIWHYGHWGTGFSAIYLKVPEKQLSLIMLSNSEALSDHQFQLGDGSKGDEITNNVFAVTFLRLFVFEDALGLSLPDPLWTESTAEFSSGLDRLRKLSKDYAYDGERDSQMALAKWITDRRSRARVPIQLDASVLDAYVGQYRCEAPLAGRVLTVSRKDAKLFVDIPRNAETELFAESESKFFLKARPFQMTFVKDKGQVRQIDLVAGGEQVRAKRIK